MSEIKWVELSLDGIPVGSVSQDWLDISKKEFADAMIAISLEIKKGIENDSNTRA